MNINTKPPAAERVAGVPLPVYPARTIPVLALGMGLSLFLAISYVLCVLGYLFLPSLPIEHSALSIFLPGFTLLSWSSFFLGLVESFGWGWYVALVLGPLYNFFAARRLVTLDMPSRAGDFEKGSTSKKIHRQLTWSFKARQNHPSRRASWRLRMFHKEAPVVCHKL